jgi:CheY-like chemotaxis protein
VLLADDDDDVARAFTRALERHGFVVRRARGGREALVIAQGGEPLAAAIVDLVLPGAGGLEVVKAVRERHPLCRIVAVTGLDEAPLRAAFVAAGADAFLAKPVDLPALLEAVSIKPA